ncbi:MAG: Wzy polymerase domain-containing protein [Burkholderiaceae bacterium]
MRLAAFLIAVAGGFLLNWALLPNVTMTNALTSVVGWGLVLFATPAPALAKPAARAVRPLLLALCLTAVGCAESMACGGVPSSQGLLTLAVLAMAGLLVAHGASASDSADAFRPFAVAVVVAGVGGALIGMLQIFAPSWLDNRLAAVLVYPGRAVGNLGQANLFGVTQVWALMALATLFPAPGAARGKASMAALSMVGASLLLGAVLSGSRLALLGIGLAAGWGAVDRGLAKPTRVALVSSVFVAAALWWSVDLWAHSNKVGVDLGQHVGSDFSSSRSAIWGRALALIAQQPWLGVGWGQFGFASTLTPAPDRTSFVDNAHDLPLQLAAELGVPLAAAIIALLAASAWRAARGARRRPGGAGVDGRAALTMVSFIGAHMLFEYPLWYAYFLLPAAWMGGLALGSSARAAAPEAGSGARADGGLAAAPAEPARWWRLSGALMAAAGAVAWLSYLSVAALYQPGPGAAPFVERLGRAEASPLFSHYADHVLAMEAQSPAEVLPQIQRAARAGFDGKLLLRWAVALEADAQHDKARFLAARLREFKLPGAAPFFAPCDDAGVAVKPFQCLPPSRALTWRDFR